jgi:hypothetical protein
MAAHRLDEAVPDYHLVRKIRALLELSWVYAELRLTPGTAGLRSTQLLMVRMLIINYVFAIRSERNNTLRCVLALDLSLPFIRAARCWG